MEVETKVADDVGFTIVLPGELEARVSAIASKRRTRRAPTTVWLIEKAVEWWEGLSREESEAL